VGEYHYSSSEIRELSKADFIAKRDELKRAYLAEQKLRMQAEARVVELETEIAKRDTEREKKRAAGRQVGKKKWFFLQKAQ